MKKIVFITLFAMITTVTAQAKQVEFESKFNTAYGCYGGLLSPAHITADLGKNSSQGEYGVFVRVNCSVDGTDDSRRRDGFSFFFRPVDGEIKREANSLFLVDAHGKTRLADKRLIGWRMVPGIELVKHVERQKRQYMVDVSIRIN